jgi:PhnB protein
MTVKPIPEGYHTVTPAIVVDDAAKAIEFYKKALGATELVRMPSPDGRVAHAEIQIGDSRIMLSDPFPEMGGPPSPGKLGGTASTLMLYVADVDAFYKGAVDAGAEPTMPVADQFWGDRYGKFRDPFGHEWAVATHTEDLTPEEMMERGNAWMAAFQEAAGRK